jgi:DNA uptake protein ComE-like DNA-binding protein
MDEGQPSSYLALALGTPVYGADGQVIGRVKQVVCDPGVDIFDGLVVATPHGDRFLTADRVTAVHEHGVDVSITQEQAIALPPAQVERHRIKFDLQGAAPPLLWVEVWEWLARHLGLSGNGDELETARRRLAERDEALRIAREDPRLAREAGVGRPDLADSHDGGVVDINHCPAEVIAGLPGVDETQAREIVRLRVEVGGFSSVEDLGLVLELPAEEVEDLRQYVVFLPE